MNLPDWKSQWIISLISDIPMEKKVCNPLISSGPHWAFQNGRSKIGQSYFKRTWEMD